MLGDTRRVSAVLFCAVACVWGASQRAGAAESVVRLSLQLRQADARQLASQLERALGAPVRLEGERKAPVSIDLTDVPGREALDAVARAVDGRWQRVYVLSGRGEGGGAGKLPSGRLVTLSVEDASVATVAGMVSKAAGARLELEGVPEKTVSLTAESEPVEAVLERLAREAGLQWRVEYAVTVAEPAAKAAAPGSAAPGSGTVGTLAQRTSGANTGRKSGKPNPRSAITAAPRKERTLTMGGLPSGIPADRALTQASFYRYIFQLPRKKREPFVQQLAEELKAADRDLSVDASLKAMLAFQRRQRRGMILAQIAALPAPHQKELKPIVDAINGGM